MNDIKIIRHKTDPNPELYKNYGSEVAEETCRYHRSFREYSRTPLSSLDAYAKKHGVGAVYVKDESCRFGLNAFKVLGGSYAIGRTLAERFSIPLNELTFYRLAEYGEEIKKLTFITATDGNHGRGVAWTASRLGASSVVYMPKGSAKERLENIRKAGADASITELNYDDAVRKAWADAQQNGWIHVQDTSWEGYDVIPGWIMQGYTTIGKEVVSQLNETEEGLPTHIFLQAGVGAMAGAISAFFMNAAGNGPKPIITIVEPDAADCFFRTAEANDGLLHPVTGDMNTCMAGLACGEPCPKGWEILNSCADFFVSMPDRVTEEGMRVLARPEGTDRKIVSGESGAAGFGFLHELLTNPDLAEQKKEMGISEESRILCISTEGDTDRENYIRIVNG